MNSILTIQFLIIIVVLLRIIWIVFFTLLYRYNCCRKKLANIFIDDKNINIKKKKRQMIVLGSGGHNGEMRQLLNTIPKNWFSHISYIHSKTDTLNQHFIDTITFKKDCIVESIDKDTISCKIHSITRSREVGQSYLSSIITTQISQYESIHQVWKEVC